MGKLWDLKHEYWIGVNTKNKKAALNGKMT